MNSSAIGKQTLTIQACYPVSLVLLSVGGGLLVPVASVSAQIVPAAGSVTNTIVNVVGDRIDINGGQYSTDNANLFQSFEQFNVSPEQTANFIASPEVENVIGKVSSDQASVINGTLQVSGSDANLYLMNPAGILMGPAAQLNLSGGFTATTATGIGFDQGEFETAVDGDYSNFTGNPAAFQFETVQPGAVVNLGELSVKEGEAINLIGGTVVNTGKLNAPGGSIMVAAVEGESTVRISQAEQLLSLEIKQGEITPTNDNIITANRIGEMLTGGEINSATALVTNTDGSVRLGHAAVDIVESGGFAIASGTISTTGDVGGNITLLGDQVHLIGAELEASGTNGGGLVRVGGDYQGKGPVFNATRTTVDAASTIEVNAVENGNGGRAIAWADGTTQFHGQLSATGGAQYGNGGFAEISGKENLTFTGLVDLGAAQGRVGDLLLDPRDIFITDSGPAITMGVDYYIPSATLENQTANIRLEATNNIVIEDLLDNELTLSEGGSATFIADADGTSAGEFIMQDLVDVIRGERKQIFITGAGITAGRIDTHTDKHNTGGAGISEVGNVTLTSSQGIAVEEIHTHGALTSHAHHSWEGGDVTITAANGDIDIARNIWTFSTVSQPSSPTPRGEEAGSAGNIILSANNGSIRISTAFPTAESVLRASSNAAEKSSGQGGIIDLFAGNGEIEIAGDIATWSLAGSGSDGDGEAGDGGNIALFATSDITVGDILASSVADGGDDSGNGGNVIVVSVDGNLSGGSIDTFSRTEEDGAKQGGDVTIQANSVQIESINTSSLASGTDSRDAGRVVLSGDSQLSVGSILATSTDGNDATISLSGNDIDLTGGANSVSGSSVNFSIETVTRDISVGADGGNDTLSLSENDLQAVSNNTSSIIIEHIGEPSRGTLTLDQSVIDSAGSRPDITIRNIEKLIGPTPVVSQAETTFRLEGPGSGQLEGAGIDFFDVRNVEGGSGDDIFRPSTSMLPGDFDSISGGSGFNTLSYEAFAGSSLTVDLDNIEIENIQRVIASAAGNNTLIGSHTGNLWSIDGSIGINSGKLNGTTFENFTTLVGGTATDRFSFVDGGGVTGSISGGMGANTIDYSLYGAPISIDLNGTATGIASGFSDIESVVGSGTLSDRLTATDRDDVIQLGNTGFVNGFAFSGIEILDGGGGNNTLVGESGDNIWTIDGVSGNTVNGIAFANFSDLVGGAGEDTFGLIGNSSVDGKLDGGNGRDRIDYSRYSAILPIEVDLARQTATGISTPYANIEGVIGSANDSDSLKGSNNNEVFQTDGNGGGNVQDLITLSTFDFSAIEKLEGQGGNNSLQGLAGANDWVINDRNSGLLNGGGFEEFSSIEGGVGANVFAFEEGGTIAGTLSGNVGTDELNYSNYNSAVIVDIGTMTTTGANSFFGIETVVGSANNDTLVGSNTNDTFTLIAAKKGNINGVIDFSSIERLNGAAGNNTLSLNLLPTTNTSIWNIDGTNRGSVDSSAFENFDTLLGSQGTDVFNIASSGAITGSIEAGTGSNTLDYSNYNNAVEVNFSAMNSTGVAGLAGINGIVGSQVRGDRIVGSTGNDTFEISSTGTGILNGTIDFADVGILNGGKGDNTFRLNGFDDTTTETTDLVIEGLVIEGGSNLSGEPSRNSLTTDGVATTWQITGTNEGTLLDADGNTIAAFDEIKQIENTSTTGAAHTVRFEQANAQLTGGIDSGNRDLRLIGNDINIGDSDGAGNNINGRISGSGRLTIRPDDESIGIVLGGVDAQEPAVLNITAGEIAAIQDGFIDISIGGAEHTGGITLGGDTIFEDSVRLRSQGDIDTRDGEVRILSGGLSLETEGAILSDRLVSQLRSVTLNAGQDITVDSITARGEQGIRVTSNNGSITTNGTLDTQGNFIGNDVLLSANTDVRINDINTSGGLRSGDVTIRAAQGGITTGGITTANNIEDNEWEPKKAGNVLLESPGSIEIEFIDARGNGLNTESSDITIMTDETFQATGTINQPELSNLITGANISGGASISTVGARAGDVTIEYGHSDTAAMRFVVGAREPNGSALRIETPQTSILDGAFLESYTQENINLINRGIVPPVVVEQSVNTINFLGADILPVSIDLVFTNNNEETDDIFNAIETQNGQAFEENLGIENMPVLSRQSAQSALREIEQSTDTTPAVLYVYFVPDAASALAVSDERNDDSARPDDQLEVMLLTGEGNSIRRRRWGVTRAQVEEANQQLRRQATSQFSRARQYLTPAQQLYDWIVRPIARTLERQNINSLGFVMDSSLRTMPISTLHDGESFLLERYSLGVLPSFSLANIHSTVNANRIDYSQERVLAMGASKFDDQPDLPAVSAEIELISQGLGAGDAFLNEEFVLETLQAQLRKEDYGIVHLATHAVFEPGDLQRSYIQLWDEQLSLTELGDLQLSEEEISLMILSACSTALGDRTSEYGFAGLAVSAGSQAALASIWPVNDEGTLGFMTQFYKELRGASVRAEALRKTQLQMIRGEVGINDGLVYGPNGETLANLPTLAESGRWDFSHPYYWSPFTMIGNPW